MPIFGSSQAARNAQEVHHIGGTLKYRFISDEPTFGTYSIFLVRAKSRQSDQLVSDRNLKGESSGHHAGSGGSFTEGTDFITHLNVMGTQINTKYWNVLYKREVNFGHPGSVAFATNVNPSNTDPRNNSVIATGQMKIPAGGTIKCFNVQEQALAGNPDMGRKPVNASQLGFLDEDNSKTCYLIVINNGVSLDLETVKLALLVKDYYKAVV